MTLPRSIWLFVPLLAALPACSDGASRDQQRAPTTAAPGHGAGMKAIVDAALADVSRRTGRPPSALKVVSAEAVTWADGSLGCAEPGVVYTMALVPGYRILVAAGDEVLDYHASAGGHLVFCPPGRGGAPAADATR